MRKLILATAVLAAPAFAQPAAQLPPKLMIVISVDQFSADLWDEYRPHFTGGLARLAGGTVFRNGYQSHAATETCPGHSTILTGMRPANSGIIANTWADRAPKRSDPAVYCAEDESMPGSSSSNYTVSALHLRVPTLGELLKRKLPASRNVAVAGKDRSAVMMGGHAPDQRWYWDGKKFSTDQAASAVPVAAVRTNAAVAAALAVPGAPLEPPALCASKSQVFAVEGGGKPVGAGRLARDAGDASGFRATPQFDGAVLALSAALIQELKLGADATPDVLSIGVSATDYVGHKYGTGGQEMCLQLLALDRELGDFFARLDSWGLDYAVALTADHGGEDIPERLRARGIADAQRIDPALASPVVGKAIAKRLGLDGPTLLGDFGNDVYLDPSLTSEVRARVIAEAIRTFAVHPQVAAVFSADQIQATPMPSGSPAGWSPIQRVRASFDPERSGDLIVLLKPHVTPIPDTSRYVATHGSPWDYDRRVPIIFRRRNMEAANREEAIETVDIMPTLAAMLGVDIDASALDGKCLSVIKGAGCATR